jgi:hypothetical protein
MAQSAAPRSCGEHAVGRRARARWGRRYERAQRGDGACGDHDEGLHRDGARDRRRNCPRELRPGEGSGETAPARAGVRGAVPVKRAVARREEPGYAVETAPGKARSGWSRGEDGGTKAAGARASDGIPLTTSTRSRCCPARDFPACRRPVTVGSAAAATSWAAAGPARAEPPARACRPRERGYRAAAATPGGAAECRDALASQAGARRTCRGRA